MSRFLPLLGTYIAFSFDLDRTFEIHHCVTDNSIASPPNLFPQRIYVGYVSSYLDTPHPARRYHRVGIRPLQQGLVTAMPEYHISSEMCVPVHPETEHPLSRTPIRTNRALPWQNCYHPTCNNIIVRLPQGVRDYSDAFVVDKRDRVDFLSTMEQDEQTIEARRLAAGESISDFHHNHHHEESNSEGYSIDGREESSHEPEEEDVYASLENDNDVILPLNSDMTSINVEDDTSFTPVVQFTSDISSGETLLSAQELYKDILELERIVIQYREEGPVPRELSHPLVKPKGIKGFFSRFISAMQRLLPWRSRTTSRKSRRDLEFVQDS